MRLHPVATSLLLAACDPSSVPVELTFPERNPHLADSVWPISHGSPHAQGSSPEPGLEGERFEVQHTTLGLPSITLAFEPDGAHLWAANPLEVYRVATGDTPEIVARTSAGGGVNDLFSGAYTLLDADGRFHTGQRDEVRVYEADGADGIATYGTYALTDAAPGETVRGLGLAYDGTLVAASSAGRLVALDRDTLTAIDEITLDGEVSNAFAIDEDGGVYVVTSEAMHRVQWTGTALSTDEADGAWRATYVNGTDDVAGGRLGAGSGSTPSLMTVGDDALVVITDAQPLMHLVAFWRDAIPEGWQAPEGTDPRTAAIVPVTFGDDDATTSVSEQSVLVMGDGAVVVNNDYGDAGEGSAPVFAGVASPGIEKFVWDPDADTLTTAWARGDVDCPNGIPTASGASGRMYCVGKRGETWTIEAVDWATGVPDDPIALGVEDDFNSTYAAAEIGPDGTVWSGTYTGLVRVRPVP